MCKILENKWFKIPYTIIKFLFFALIIVYVCFIGFQRLSGNKSIGGYRVFTVATGSMAGVYDVRDVILVKEVDVSTLKVGDDIAYQGNRGGLEGKIITHRIIKIDDSGDKRIFTTKGVKSDIEDPSISEKQILGKVQGTVPIISQISHIISSQLGFFVFIFVPLVLLIVLEILQTITEIKIDNGELEEIKKDNNDKIIEVKEEVKENKDNEDSELNKESIERIDKIIEEKIIDEKNNTSKTKKFNFVSKDNKKEEKAEVVKIIDTDVYKNKSDEDNMRGDDIEIL